MYKFITLNGEVYVKTEPTFWTRERKLWGSTLILVAGSLARIVYKKGVSWIK